MIYGNFDLRRKDHDGKPAQNTPPRWGGVENPPVTVTNAETAGVTSGSSAALAVPEHVRKLQEDLISLGFSVLGKATGEFGPRTEWAVREFQIYASMVQVACVRNEKRGQLLLDQAGSPVRINNLDVYYDGSAGVVAKAGKAPAVSGSTIGPVSYYVDSLQSVANAARYTGPISGVVNEKTRTAIEHWLNSDYRCPVVFEAWRMAGGSRTDLAEKGCNVWAHDSFTEGGPRVAFRDFSSYFTFPDGRAQTEYHAVGYYQSGNFGGPNAGKVHSWSSQTEMTVEKITGAPANPAQLNSPSLSTYRTIRVVAEAECFGRFDVLNAWDNALISGGPCHWTMGLFAPAPINLYGKGELPGFMAYLKNREPEVFEKVFGNFGLYPTKEWGAPGFYDEDLMTYAAWVKLANDSYAVSQTTHSESEFTELAASEDEANYLKTWHWFYRLSMAARTIPKYRSTMWSMAKLRLREILTDPISFNVGSVVVNSTVGAIYTSEKAVAILLRWHVWRPSHVVSGGQYNRLRNVLQNTINTSGGVNWQLPIASWGEAHEAALATKLFNALQALNDTIAVAIVYGTSEVQGAVRTGRNTFVMEN
ncbi:hypothetical protein PseAD21_14390 [Pseudomonas sp. AD21]|uniref:peptidoglycan-binding domain-containing protein n=1 Tax=Pseudomonas sp. AD21 TaxID=396378 RepID=UPI000C82D803|nr:peptidoglycan-binding protein [Pseudomonas sp. AD21]PMQ11008.1 hypothetical protein PseAD21_14390 [Pseudomonas sp. AD21]